MAKNFKKIKFSNWKKYWQETILAILTVSYSVYFTVASFLKYDNYYAGRFDLGNMSQTVWNTANGNIFMLTDPNGTREISRLAFHADFILILLAPFYFIWEDPRMLLLIQTIVLSFGGIFVYLTANHLLKNKTLSLAFSACFFLNPAVNYTNLFDFHSVTLATTFFLGTFYFILKKKYLPAVIFLILAGITKEQTWAINALFGLYLIFISKQRIIGALTFTFSLLIFYFLIWHAIPNALGSEHFATQFFGEFGDSPTSIIKNIILNPIQTIQTLLEPDRISYIKQLFMPLGYLSFIGFPFLIFAGPDLMINLLSGSPQMHQIYYQYSATVTPFIFISAIFAISWIKKALPEIPNRSIAIVILILTFLSAYTYGPLLFAKKPTNAMFKKQLVNKMVVDKYLRSIPNDEKISATNNLGSHLSHRKFIYTIPVGMTDAEKIVLLVKENSSQKEKDALNALLMDPTYLLMFRDQDFYVFKNLRP